MYFSTTDKENKIIDAINKQRALDLLYDVDREAVGLGVSGRAEDFVEECSLCFFMEKIEKGKETIYYYSLQTNVEAWILALKGLNNFSYMDMVREDKPPWKQMSRKSDVMRIKIDLDAAKKIISFDERCKHRAYDIAFIVYLKYAQQKVSVSNMLDTMKLFYNWLNTDMGKTSFSECFELCKQALSR